MEKKNPIEFCRKDSPPQRRGQHTGTQSMDTWRTNSAANTVSADSLLSMRLCFALWRFSQIKQEQFSVDVSCPGFPRAQLRTPRLVLCKSGVLQRWGNAHQSG